MLPSSTPFVPSAPRRCGAPAVRRRRGRRLRRFVLALVVLLAAATAPAQGEEVGPLLERAREVVRQARGAYQLITPDQPLWREALRLGHEALALAPDDPEALRFLARTYAESGWHIRAWQSFERLRDAGVALGSEPVEGAPSDVELFAGAGSELAYARYQAGDSAGAGDYYRQVLDLVPDDPEALGWLARIELEAGRPQEALPYWQRLVEAHPDDAGFAYQLALTEEQLTVGIDASNAYRRGLAAYDEGRLDDALAAFEEALAANGDFLDAVVWAGRSALELGRSQTAERYWGRVLELEPDDERASYFIEVARAQEQWGVVAADAFYRGQGLYGGGDKAAAADAFKAALQANPDFLDAWVWTARTLQEIERPEEAIYYWQGVLKRSPDDSRASYFLELARQQLAFGAVAGAAFVDAVRHYQLAEFDEAERGFRQAVEANPDFAAAWGWLGRLFFTEARYPEAADAYAKAAELDSDNSDYAFFADEARRLAGDEENRNP